MQKKLKHLYLLKATNIYINSNLLLNIKPNFVLKTQNKISKFII